MTETVVSLPGLTADPDLALSPVDRPRFERTDHPLGDHSLVIEMSGELDLLATPTLVDDVASALRGGVEHIVVDVSKATFIDSAILGAIVRCSSMATRAGGRLVLVADQPYARRTFELTGLDRVIEIRASVGEAVAGRPS